MRCIYVLLAVLFAFHAEAQDKKPKKPPQETPEVSPVKLLSEEGTTKFKEGKYPEAIIFFQQAYSLENNPGFLWNIAICLLKLDRTEEAISYLDAVLVGAAPESIVYRKAQEKLSELTQTSTPKKSPQEALQVVEQLKKADPAEIKRIADEGNQRFQDKKFEEAIALYKKAYQLDNRPGFLFNIGRCHSMLSDWSAAKDTYRLVLVLLKEGDPMRQKAAEYYQEAQDQLLSAPKRVVAEEPTTRPKPINESPKRPAPVRALYGASAASFVLGGASLVTGATYLIASPRSAILAETPAGKLAPTKSIARNNALGAIYLGASGGLIGIGVGSYVAGNLLNKKLSTKSVTVSTNASQILLTVRY